MDLEKEVGRKIETLRVVAGLGQRELSDKLKEVGLNWSQGTLSKVENGSRPIRFTEAVIVAEVLNVSTTELQPSGGFVDVMYQRSQWVLESLRENLKDAENRFRDAANHTNALLLIKELVNGARGPFHVHGSGQDLINLGTRSTRASQSGDFNYAQVFELLDVSQARIDEVKKKIEMELQKYEETGVDPDVTLPSLPGDPVPPSWWLKEAARDQSNREFWINEMVGYRYAETLLHERYPQLTFAGDDEDMEVTGVFTVDGLPDAGEIEDV